MPHRSSMDAFGNRKVMIGGDQRQLFAKNYFLLATPGNYKKFIRFAGIFPAFFPLPSRWFRIIFSLIDIMLILLNIFASETIFSRFFRGYFANALRLVRA
jgi:hypothetical protein